jgi:hypothetical protein
MPLMLSSTLNDWLFGKFLSVGTTELIAVQVMAADIGYWNFFNTSALLSIVVLGV